MTHWEILHKYISEHGQQYGTVSWQMARDSLEILRCEYSAAFDRIVKELGVPGRNTPGNVANAHATARKHAGLTD